jgi:tRNA nucleotidyltransferase (CCA-adding enzyme)
VDVGGLLRTIGGGGHAQAASAVMRDSSPQEVLDRILAALDRTTLGLSHPKAGEIMSRPVRLIDADTPVTEALITAQRYGHSGICVRADGLVVGIVARRDLDKAMRHGLGHAPVKGVMTRNITFARASTTVDELRRGRVSLSALPQLRALEPAGWVRPPLYRPSFSLSRKLTVGGTSAETSPPSDAASLTMLELT